MSDVISDRINAAVERTMSGVMTQSLIYWLIRNHKLITVGSVHNRSTLPKFIREILQLLLSSLTMNFQVNEPVEC